MCELKQLYGASTKITIPIHEEEGWTVRSPEHASASVKARLQEATSPKSPEALKRIEERAAQLHRLHVEAKQQRAAKENRRAEEVAALPRHSHAISFALVLATALVPPSLSMPPPIIRHRPISSLSGALISLLIPPRSRSPPHPPTPSFRL